MTPVHTDQMVVAYHLPITCVSKCRWFIILLGTFDHWSWMMEDTLVFINFFFLSSLCLLLGMSGVDWPHNEQMCMKKLWRTFVTCACRKSAFGACREEAGLSLSALCSWWIQSQRRGLSSCAAVSICRQTCRTMCLKIHLEQLPAKYRKAV